VAGSRSDPRERPICDDIVTSRLDFANALQPFSPFSGEIHDSRRGRA
jgi:hypothetical protein